MSDSEIKINDRGFETELIVRFGARYQAIALKRGFKKQQIVAALHNLAENIRHDDKIKD